MAYCNNTGSPAPCGTAGTAYWNSPTTGFGSKQAAAFQFDNTLTTGNTAAPGYSLILKATSVNATDVALDSVRVTYIPGTGVRVAYTVTRGASYTTVGTLAGAFAANDIMGAMVTPTGLVYVWKTSGGVTTLLGTEQLPSTAAWTTGGGLIGIQLPPGAEVDNFAGGVVP